MESLVLNTSVSVTAQLVSGLSNVTTSSTSTTRMNSLTEDVVPSVPVLIKTISSTHIGTDIQNESTTFKQAVDYVTSDSLTLSTERNRVSTTFPSFVDGVMKSTAPTPKVNPKTTDFAQYLHREFNMSTPDPDSATASLDVQSETDERSLLDLLTSSAPVQNENVEESTFRQLTSPVTGISSGIFQQPTELSTELKSPNVTELSAEFKSLSVSVLEDVSNVVTVSPSVITTPFSAATDKNIPWTTADPTFIDKARTELATNVSSLIDGVFNAEHKTDSAVQSEGSFNITNTASPVTLWEHLTNNSHNATDVDWQYPPVYDVIMEDYDDSTAVMVAKVTTLAILAVAGVMGNAMVIWSVVRQRHLHRPPFYYLLSLSLTDLSRAAFCLPLVLMTLLQGSVWRHGNSACDLFAFANAFFVLSSGVSLLDIAADRHLSLVYSRSYRRRSGGALNLVVVLLGWSLAFLVAFPPVVGVGSYAFEESEGQCTLRHKFFRHNNDTLGFLMVFTALMIVTLFLYYRIFMALRAHRKMRPLDHEPARSATWTFVGPGANGQAFVNWVNGFGGTHLGNLPNLVRNPPRPNIARLVNLHVARNQHVTRLFFLMTLTFNALWLPYQVLSYWRVFGGAEQIEGGFVTAAAWLSYGQVVVCPVVYFSSRGAARPRPSRADLSPQDKQEYLLESVNRKK